MQDMVRFGNLATRAQLAALGYSQRDIRRAVDEHQVWPIRRSWVAHAGADWRATRAIALGGRLAAASALATYGVWVTRPSGLWVQSPPTAARLPQTDSGEHRLWSPEHFPFAGDRQWRMSLPDSLLQAVRLSSAEDAIASLDSALNLRLLTPALVGRIFDVLPRRYRRLALRLNGKAESGLETMLRLAAEGEGLRVEVQVSLPGVGRVDLLIDGWLVIELDGGQWHDDEASQDEDRRREAEMTMLGYGWHRFRYKQIMEDLPGCLDVIRTKLASGRPNPSAALR
jgi:very-short-patch-repair endonuclease